MSKTDVTYKGVDLEVQYDYQPAEYEDGYLFTPEGCTVEQVFVKGVDITELIDENDLDAIATILMEPVEYDEPDVDEAQEWHDFDPDC